MLRNKYYGTVPWQFVVYAEDSRMMVNVKVLSDIVEIVLLTTPSDNFVT